MIMAKGRFVYQVLEFLSLFRRSKLLYLSIKGYANQAVSYFGSIGYQCPAFSNPADYIMTLISGGSSEENDAKFEKMFSSFDERLKPQIENDTSNLLFAS